MRSGLLATALLVIPAAAPAGENWPQFRGPDGTGHSDATGLPTKWSETENVRWKTPIHGKAWSSPVIWGKQIWLTSATEDGHELYVLCVDRDTGKILRDEKLWDVPEPGDCHVFNSYASPTPVIEQGRVYVHFGSNGTACLDTKTGKMLWSRRDLPCNHFRGAGSSPILYNDLLIFHLDGFDYQYVVALDKKTGATRWKADRGIPEGGDGDRKKAYGTPHVIEVAGKPQLISPAALVTCAYEPETGREIWRVNSGGMNASARPLFGHGLVYITSPAGGFNLFAMKPDGEGDITGSHVVWKSGRGAPSRSSELLIGDHIFMVNDSSVAQCLDAKTGKAQWKDGHRFGGNYSASPIFADGRIYFCSETGESPVMEPVAAEPKVLATNKLDDGFMASPAVAGNALYLRTRTHLYRIEE